MHPKRRRGLRSPESKLQLSILEKGRKESYRTTSKKAGVCPSLFSRLLVSCEANPLLVNRKLFRIEIG